MFQLLKRLRRSPSSRPVTRLRLEALEDRQLLSAAPLGAALDDNTGTTSTVVHTASVQNLETGASGVSGQQGSSAAATAPRTLGTLPQSPVVFIADTNNEVHEWDGSQWHDLGQGAIAPDGSFWFLGPAASGSTTAPLYRSVNGQLDQQTGSWTGLLGITDDGQVWVTSGSSVFRGDGSSWTEESTPTTQALAQSAGLGGSVTAYARQFLGQTSPPGSRGECTDLVSAALQSAGAETTDDFGVSGPDSDYVWGTLVADHSVTSSGGQTVASDAVAPLPIRAGDIIQMRDVTLTSQGVNPDGSTWTQTTTMDHHSVIIEAALGGDSYRILEQNWDFGKPDGRVVRESTINLADMTQGQYWIYQPVEQTAPASSGTSA